LKSKLGKAPSILGSAGFFFLPQSFDRNMESRNIKKGKWGIPIVDNRKPRNTRNTRKRKKEMLEGELFLILLTSILLSGIFLSSVPFVSFVFFVVPTLAGCSPGSGVAL
jgi:hypothetical protein